MNRWIEDHPQEVQDIERLDEDNRPTRRVVTRILDDEAQDDE